MGITRYEMAVKVMEEYIGETMGVQTIRTIIIKKLGGDERTINGYLMVMRSTGIIKEVENMRFKVNGRE